LTKYASDLLDLAPHAAKNHRPSLVSLPCASSRNNVPRLPKKRATNTNAPTKAKKPRFFQSPGGSKTRGAAATAATARKFSGVLPGSSGAARVKLIDSQIRDGKASRSERRPTGRPLGFDTSMAESLRRIHN